MLKILHVYEICNRYSLCSIFGLLNRNPEAVFLFAKESITQIFSGLDLQCFNSTFPDLYSKIDHYPFFSSIYILIMFLLFTNLADVQHLSDKFDRNCIQHEAYLLFHR